MTQQETTNQYERIASFEFTLHFRDLRRRRWRNLAAIATLIACLSFVGCV